MFRIPGTSRRVAGITPATQAQQEAGSSTTVVVTPGRQQFHQSAAKMWAHVDRSAGTPVLSSPSYNITSVADVSAGRTTVTVATDFSTAIFSIGGGGIGDGTQQRGVTTGALAVGAVDFFVSVPGGTASDTTDFMCWAFGDH